MVKNGGIILKVVNCTCHPGWWLRIVPPRLVLRWHSESFRHNPNICKHGAPFVALVTTYFHEPEGTMSEASMNHSACLDPDKDLEVSLRQMQVRSQRQRSFCSVVFIKDLCLTHPHPDLRRCAWCLDLAVSSQRNAWAALNLLGWWPEEIYGKPWLVPMIKTMCFACSHDQNNVPST